MNANPGCDPVRLIRCQTWGGEKAEIDVSAGFITRVAPAGAPGTRGHQTIDAAGALVLPGLWDHHIHAEQWAMALARVPLQEARGPDDVIAAMAAALAARGGEETLTGFGFHGGDWLSAMDAARLDAVSPSVPVVAISGDWHSAWLNTPALAQARRLGHRSGDGVVRENEWFELAAPLTSVSLTRGDELIEVAMAQAAARGVTGVTDLEKGASWRTWQRRYLGGFRAMRVTASVWPGALGDAITAGIRTGEQLVPGLGLGTMGPLKVIADGSLGSRTAACRAPYPGGGHGCLLHPAAELAELLTRAHGAGIEAAVHAIGDRAAGEVLRAFSASGATGCVEHAQLLEARDIRRLARQGLTASVQPRHLIDDKDAVDSLWAARAGRAFALRDLAAAGIRLAFGSDAPVAPLDPWQAIAAATYRTDGTFDPWHPDQRVPLAHALAASMPLRHRGEPPSSRLVPQAGDRADLIVLEQDPRRVDPAGLWRLPVAATMVAGHWTHGGPG